MKKYILILLAVCCTALGACSGDQGKQQPQFEEKQNNREHAVKLYVEVVTKYPGTPNAKIAQERLSVLKGGR